MGDYRASPAEIGRMRREIREAVRHHRESGVVPTGVLLEVKTLDDHSLMWLKQRMRPAELAMVDLLRGKPPERG